MKPRVEVGLHHDGGDTETEPGMDLGAGLALVDEGSGLGGDVRIRTLLAH